MEVMLVDLEAVSGALESIDFNLAIITIQLAVISLIVLFKNR